MLAEENMKNNPIFLILFSSLAFTQTFQLVDESNYPITYAQIYNTNLGIGSISDSDGYFTISYEKCIELNIDYIGFQKKIINTCTASDIIRLIKSPLPSREISVIGDLGNSKLKNLISDVQLFSKNDIVNSNKEDLSDVLKSSTNLAYSSLHSRVKYFQIRGIGEIEQFVGQAGPNYYVGTMIDEVNLSGIGMPIFLHDVEQVEIFKGPQSFTVGQNAMAGLIRVNTINPKAFFESKFSIDVGNYGKNNLTFMLNQPLNANTALRFSVAKNKDDGFIFNNYYGKYLNGKNELISNFKIKYNKALNSGNLFSLSAMSMHSDLDNGNDKWSHSNFNELDVTNFETDTDFIGRDTFLGKSNIIKGTFVDNKNFQKINLIFTKSKYDLNYDYDGDWSNESHWNDLYTNPLSESYSENAYSYWAFPTFESRSRHDNSMEFKLSKSFKKHNLIFGIFKKEITERDLGTGFIFDLGVGYVDNYKTRYSTDYNSFYMQHTLSIDDEKSLTLNFRNDDYNNEFDYNYTYYDNNSYLTSEYKTDGQVYKYSNSIQSFRIGTNIDNFYFSVSKGHKAGGMNLSPSSLVTANNDTVTVLNNIDRTYDPETNVNYDIGYSLNFKNLNLNLTLFYMDRKNVQVKLQDQIGDCPTCYLFITKNITEAINTGIDLESSYRLNSNFLMFLNLGLLETERASYSHTNYAGAANYYLKRELSNAPKWSLATGFEYSLNDLFFVRYDISSKDSYYYYDDLNDKSSVTTTHNINSRYIIDENINLTIWVKNLTNKVYPAHIYNFSHGPGLEAQQWKSPTLPMTYGLKLDYKF